MNRTTRIILTCALAALITPLAIAQPPAAQLDQMVARVALYPDPLLSQVFAAATYSDQIPGAARWADEHSYLHGDALANAIREDELPWDPSVQALLPFRSVLDMMASDMNWTRQLGDAFLQSRDAVMDAVQRRRHEAEEFGYLRSNGQILVNTAGGYVDIEPVNPAFIPVPVYDPGVVYLRPRAGFFAGGAITFGGISIGAAFAPWGWGHSHFDWGQHGIVIENHPWERRWENRSEYVHPYANVRRFDAGHRVERHQVHHEESRRHDKH
ncbi:MAG TPA: DUF3300 domain-containing protein [Bryobacteraceae bacterium]|nr:DUF3300 domain-containing protein [Bryobacteraceae bacterium]